LQAASGASASKFGKPSQNATTEIGSLEKIAGVDPPKELFGYQNCRTSPLDFPAFNFVKTSRTKSFIDTPARLGGINNRRIF
jgi:hypothetical protein